MKTLVKFNTQLLVNQNFQRSSTPSQATVTPKNHTASKKHSTSKTTNSNKPKTKSLNNPKKAKSTTNVTNVANNQLSLHQLHQPNRKRCSRSKSLILSLPAPTIWSYLTSPRLKHNKERIKVKTRRTHRIKISIRIRTCWSWIVILPSRLHTLVMLFWSRWIELISVFTSISLRLFRRRFVLN